MLTRRPRIRRAGEPRTCEPAFDLADAAAAHRLSESGHVRRKVAVRV
jgi:hypothetical protein